MSCACAPKHVGGGGRQCARARVGQWTRHARQCRRTVQPVTMTVARLSVAVLAIAAILPHSHCQESFASSLLSGETLPYIGPPFGSVCYELWLILAPICANIPALVIALLFSNFPQRHFLSYIKWKVCKTFLRNSVALLNRDIIKRWYQRNNGTRSIQTFQKLYDGRMLMKISSNRFLI